MPEATNKIMPVGMHFRASWIFHALGGRSDRASHRHFCRKNVTGALLEQVHWMLPPCETMVRGRFVLRSLVAEVLLRMKAVILHVSLLRGSVILAWAT